MTEEDTTKEAEEILYTLAKLHMHRGEATEVAILADCEAVLNQTDYDGYNGDRYFYTLFLKVSMPIYTQIANEREEYEKKFLEDARQFFRVEKDWYLLEAVKISPRVAQVESDWREHAKSWAQGIGVTNQGRVRSSNIASKEKDGLLFRSQAEIHLYMALKALGVSFAPLPVFVRGGKTYQRMEPDFIVIKDGITLQIEVDGDTVHTETPAEAQTRVAMLEDEGVHVLRVAASKCDTFEKAQNCAQEILAKISTRKGLK